MSIDLERQREWDEAARLYFYNKENELLLHSKCGTVYHCSRYVGTCMNRIKALFILFLVKYNTGSNMLWDELAVSIVSVEGRYTSW